MVTTTETRTMTSAQQQVFDDLLEVGATRPYATDGLADHLRGILVEGTAPAVARWTEPSLWLSKSHLSTVRRCEGQTLAYAEDSDVSVPALATVAGIVAHRGIQVAYTHPGRAIRSYVDWALAAAKEDDPGVALFWESASPVAQSDLISKATEKVSGFLDSWPDLDPAWEPRFEAALQAKLGKLTLAGRADLVLGRPRPPRQTMLLCDVKTGSLHDGHLFEASFYALISTLRHGVPPFKSVVYSVASGDWVGDPVTAESLTQTAHEVVKGVIAHVDLLTASRPADLSPGPACRWCPAKDTCEGASLAEAVSGIAVNIESVTGPTASAATAPADPSSPETPSEDAAEATNPPTDTAPAETPSPGAGSTDEGPHGPFTL